MVTVRSRNGGMRPLTRSNRNTPSSCASKWYKTSSGDSLRSVMTRVAGWPPTATSWKLTERVVTKLDSAFFFQMLSTGPTARPLHVTRTVLDPGVTMSKWSHVKVPALSGVYRTLMATNDSGSTTPLVGEKKKTGSWSLSTFSTRKEARTSERLRSTNSFSVATSPGLALALAGAPTSASPKLSSVSDAEMCANLLIPLIFIDSWTCCAAIASSCVSACGCQAHTHREN